MATLNGVQYLTFIISRQWINVPNARHLSITGIFHNIDDSVDIVAGSARKHTYIRNA